MHPDPAETRDRELLALFLDDIPVDDSPPAKPQCGMCENYQEPRIFKHGKKAWGYCQLRAAADIHPCNLPPWDSYAAECRWYVEEVPF